MGTASLRNFCNSLLVSIGGSDRFFLRMTEGSFFESLSPFGSQLFRSAVGLDFGLGTWLTELPS